MIVIFNYPNYTLRQFHFFITLHDDYEEYITTI